MQEQLTTETIECRPIDKEKIVERFSKKEEPIEIVIPIAIINCHGENYWITEDFVGCLVKEDVPIETMNKFSKDSLVSGLIKIPITQIDNFLSEKTTLSKFTKSRRRYNSRIINNEEQWIRKLNEQ